MNLKNIKYKRVLLLLISSYLGWGTGFALGSEYIDVGPVPINREADHKYKIQPRGGSPKRMVVPEGQVYTTASKSWNRGSYSFDNATYHTVEVQKDAVWRPMDIYDESGGVRNYVFITNELHVKGKGIVDLGYLLGPENYPDNPVSSVEKSTDDGTGRILRNGWGTDRWLHTSSAFVEDQAVMRVNVGNTRPAKFNPETGNLDTERDSASIHWLGKLKCTGTSSDGKTRLYIEPYYHKTFGGYLSLVKGDGSLVEYLDFKSENKDTLNFWKYRNTPYVRGRIALLGYNVTNIYPLEGEDPTDPKFYDYIKDDEEKIQVLLRNEKFSTDGGLNKWKIRTKIHSEKYNADDSEDKIKQYGKSNPDRYEYFNYYKKDPKTGKYLYDKNFNKIIDRKVLRKHSYDRLYSIDWEAERTEMKSQGFLQATQGQLAMRNSWKTGMRQFYKRPEQLRMMDFRNYLEGPWANYVHGKNQYSTENHQTEKENYRGVILGYDKKFDWKPGNGDIYAGVFMSALKSDSHLGAHSITENGYVFNYDNIDYKTKNYSIGLYTTWNRTDGWYIDMLGYASKLKNKSLFVNRLVAEPDYSAIEYATWAYGAGLWGGKIFEHDQWRWTPRVGVLWGQMSDAVYREKNGMSFSQGGERSFIFQAGLTVDRRFSKGRMYVKGTFNHEMGDAGIGTAELVGYKYGDYNNKQKVIVDSQTYEMDPVVSSWWELGLGLDWKWNRNSSLWLEWSRTFGNQMKSPYQLQLGLSMAVGAGNERKGEGAAGKKETVHQSPVFLEYPKTEKAQPKEVVIQGKMMEKPESVPESKNVQPLAPYIESVPDSDNFDEVISEEMEPVYAYSRAAPVSEKGYLGRFNLGNFVVEQTKKRMSPGTYSVIDAEKYSGENKTLPELLQKVPGVHILYSGGTGRRTYAQIRGSSPNEVHVYVDGVLQNTGANEAVDLSMISADQIEKIEVYRGYIPVRFGGAAIGGVISITTKSPETAQSYIKYGKRSFEGQTIGAQARTPLWGGNLLISGTWDKYGGKFPYQNYQAYRQGFNSHHFYFMDLKEIRHRKDNSFDKKDVLLKWQKDSYYAKLNWKRNEIEYPQPAGTIGWRARENAYWWRHLNVFQGRKTSVDRWETTVGQQKDTDKFSWDWRLSYWVDKNTAEAEPAVVIVERPDNPDIPVILPVYQNKDFRDINYEGNVNFSWRPTSRHTVEFMAKHSIEKYEKYGGKWNSKKVTHVPGSPYSDDEIDNALRGKMLTSYHMENTYVQLQDRIALDRHQSFFWSAIGRLHKTKLAADKPSKEWGRGSTDVDPPGWLKNGSMEGKWRTSFGMALEKNFGTALSVRGTYGTYYKPPNLFELFGDGVSIVNRYYGSNEFHGHKKNLVIDQSYGDFVETGQTWDIGMDFHKKVRGIDFSSHLTYFNRHSENMQVKVLNERGFSFYRNLAAAKIKGVEWESRAEKGRWELEAALTWQKSLVTRGSNTSNNAFNAYAGYEGSLPFYTGYPIPNIPKWEGNLRVAYALTPRLKTFIEGHYKSKVYENHKVGGMGGRDDEYKYSNPMHLTAESLLTMNWGLKYEKTNGFELVLGVNDLLNRGSRQKVFYDDLRTGERLGYNIVEFPQEGRSYYINLKCFI